MGGLVIQRSARSGQPSLRLADTSVLNVKLTLLWKVELGCGSRNGGVGPTFYIHAGGHRISQERGVGDRGTAEGVHSPGWENGAWCFFARWLRERGKTSWGVRAGGPRLGLAVTVSVGGGVGPSPDRPARGNG